MNKFMNDKRNHIDFFKIPACFMFHCLAMDAIILGHIMLLATFMPIPLVVIGAVIIATFEYLIVFDSIDKGLGSIATTIAKGIVNLYWPDHFTDKDIDSKIKQIKIKAAELRNRCDVIAEQVGDRESVLN